MLLALLPKQESGVSINPTNSTTTEADLRGLVAELFELHHAAVFNYVYRLTSNEDWANDLTQEAFLKLFHNRHQLAGVKNHRAWIYRIASNLTFNALKRRNRFQWLPWIDRDEKQLKTADPAANLDQQEQVQKTLNAIEPKYRAPLILYGQYGLSIREIAEIMELSESNVKVRLHRGRKMFRAMYKG